MKKSLALLAILLLAGCSSVSSDGNNHAAEADISVGSHEVVEIGSPKEAIGWILTVNSVTPVKGDLDMVHTAERLEEGTQYVIVDTTVRNDSGQDQPVSTLDFEMKDESGNKYLPVLGVETEMVLDCQLPDGTDKSGQMVFTVPTEGELILVYSPEIMSSETIEIRVQ